MLHDQMDIYHSLRIQKSEIFNYFRYYIFNIYGLSRENEKHDFFFFFSIYLSLSKFFCIYYRASVSSEISLCLVKAMSDDPGSLNNIMEQHRCKLIPVWHQNNIDKCKLTDNKLQTNTWLPCSQWNVNSSRRRRLHVRWFQLSASWEFRL